MTRPIYLGGVNFESMVDGPGVRTTLFISGCNHRCRGCHNPSAQSFSYGTVVEPDVVQAINQEIEKRPFLSGITLSGGDPFFSAEGVLRLLDMLSVPNGNIWAYSGYTAEALLADPATLEYRLLLRCSVLVDGPYNADLRDITLRYRGSLNQRLIDVPSTIQTGQITLWRNVLAN